MSQQSQTTETPIRAVKASELLAAYGLSGWAALRALAEFYKPESVVSAHCQLVDQAGVIGPLDDFLSSRGTVRTFPEHVVTEEEVRVLAREMLEVFVRKDMDGFFLGSYSGSSLAAAIVRFEKFSGMLGADTAREVIASVDEMFRREMGDAWEAYKYGANIGWPDPPDLDAIERYARSIPEEQWGGNEINGFTRDLEAVLRAALADKQSGRRPESGGVTRDAATVGDEIFLRELEEMRGKRPKKPGPAARRGDG